MKKDFKFIFFLCIAAVILSLFSLPWEFIPRHKLFEEDNPLNELQSVSEESEVSDSGLE